ncbi:condensin complex protein MksE [Tenacibaculum maritimum]|uniref:Uncharacterized protein n=1 Tax=Tenacibaculum maritimum NCIMB 2154 TaxID=1349785 RepID=A0A2H1E662_9FLAO|nr:hypothetical protein [Tenacibaculum maritimum]SFZ80260.1 conserved protein of unknown function [Tenacibaculum maritimum NCIMB 2154]
MENNDISEIEYLDFLKEEDAIQYFGKLDYLLKDGTHFQCYGDQIPYYRFLKKNKKSIKAFYQRFYGIILKEENKESDSYFFLDFNDSSRGNIPQSFRDILKNDYIIIGLIMYKILHSEKNLELTSIIKLKQTIRNDYQSFKPGLIKLIAQSTADKDNFNDDETIDNAIERALKQFRKLAWLDYKGDTFELRASFHRIITLYEDIIPKIDTVIESYQ